MGNLWEVGSGFKVKRLFVGIIFEIKGKKVKRNRSNSPVCVRTRKEGHFSISPEPIIFSPPVEDTAAQCPVKPLVSAPSD